MMEILAYTPTTLAEAMHASRPTVYRWSQGIAQRFRPLEQQVVCSAIQHPQAQCPQAVVCGFL